MSQAFQEVGALRDLILKAKHAYYYSGEPIMSDTEFDALEDQLRRIAPDDPVLALVGSPVPDDTILTKARHSIPMGSQSKVNSEAEFLAWALKGEGCSIHASLKGDGASAAAYYRQGRLVQAISRGDGVIGEDITANAMRFKGLPAWAGEEGRGFTGAVRFEVILTVEDWAAIDPGRSKNPRNAGNGIMGRKNGHQSDRLTAFAFEIDETIDGQSYVFTSEAEKARRLSVLGFNLIPQKMCASALEAVAYFQEIAAARESLPFWIDGLVMKMDDLALQIRMGVTSGRPKGQVAWKFDSSGAETELTGVIISGGHTGSIVPTGQLRPVDIGGTTVSSVSLVNFDEIARLDVAVGDSVWVVKANDIIPKVVRVTSRPEHRQPIRTPQACPFCGGEVGRRINTSGDEGVILECRNAACDKKSSGKINRWISSLDILGIGDVVLESMIEQMQIVDAADLYSLKDRFVELAGLVTHAERDLRLGEKRASNILAAIESKRVLTLSQFIGSLGIEHLGKRRVEMIIEASRGALDTLGDWRGGKLREPAFAASAGVPSIAIPIQDGIDAMSTVIDKMLANGVEILQVQRAVEESDRMSSTALKKVCISGKLPRGKKKTDYQSALLAAGYELVDEVTKDLCYLVVADETSTSSKAVKAAKLGVPVITEEGLVSLVSARNGGDVATSNC
jgi:DNA ligase (NAD+)